MDGADRNDQQGFEINIWPRLILETYGRLTDRYSGQPNTSPLLRLQKSRRLCLPLSSNVIFTGRYPKHEL